MLQYLVFAGLVGYSPATQLHADLWRILAHIPISIISEQGNLTHLSTQ